jgi:hypothetical protein
MDKDDFSGGFFRERNPNTPTFVYSRGDSETVTVISGILDTADVDGIGVSLNRPYQIASVLAIRI